MSVNDNHRSWAKHYDEVNRRCFGSYYDQLTAQTTARINNLGTNLKIADFGAGTGRLSLPLAQYGHEVTAIEPSEAMLEQLRAKTTDVGVRTHHASLTSYTGPGGHDLALAVFTVIAYILTPEELVTSFKNVARTLKPNGALLLDIPKLLLFSNNPVEKPDISRQITFQHITGNIYEYEENTCLEVRGEKVVYHDHFRLRYWSTDEVSYALQRAGLIRSEDWSNHFPYAGADYWLYRKAP